MAKTRFTMKAYQARGSCIAILVGSIIAFAFSGLIGAWLWTYSINSWCEFFGKPETCLWWHGFLIGCVPYFGYLSIPIAVVTFIVSFFF